jgi:hypothetical protein
MSAGFFRRGSPLKVIADFMVLFDGILSLISQQFLNQFPLPKQQMDLTKEMRSLPVKYTVK